MDEWSELLFVASYDGVLFDVITTADDVSRVLARHEFPFRNGAVLQDMGGVPRVTSCSIIFIPVKNQASDHIDRFKRFVNLLEAAATKDKTPLLIHPLTGGYRALPEGINFDAAASSRDQILLSVDFVEGGLDAAAFTTTSDQSVGSGVAQTETATAEVGSVLSDADDELAEIIAAEPVTVHVDALTLAQSWQNNPSLTARDVNLELNRITNEIVDETTRMEVTLNVKRYPTYLAMQRLHAAIRFSAELAIQTAPKLFEHTVTRSEPLLALMTEIYGGVEALDRYDRTRELNDIENPQRVEAGTTLTLEQV